MGIMARPGGSPSIDAVLEAERDAEQQVAEASRMAEAVVAAARADARQIAKRADARARRVHERGLSLAEEQLLCFAKSSRIGSAPRSAPTKCERSQVWWVPRACVSGCDAIPPRKLSGRFPPARGG